MGAAYFYHLTRSPLEVTLPMLLCKARSVGWRIAVRGTSEDRMNWLDDTLWVKSGDDFMPHGKAGGDFDVDQPVLLTTTSDCPNGAQCLMTMDGAEVAPGEVEAMDRVCVLFDGNDAEALQKARAQWKLLTEAGCEAQYWSQADGGWSKKAESK